MFMSDSKMTRNSDSDENVLYYNNGNLSSVQLNCYPQNVNSRSELLPCNSNVSMSRAEWLRLFGFYLSQILLLAVSCIYLTVVVINLVQSYDDLKGSKDPLYKLSSLTITTTALAIFLALHGNLCQRNYDLYLYFFDIALLTYFGYLNDVWGPDKRFLNNVQKLLGFAATPIIGILVFFNRQMFDQFNIIGASPSIISMYKTYCYFQALIKWDFQNMIIMANFVFVMSNSLIVNLIIFASLIAYACLVWIIAKIAVQKESIYLVFLHVALSFVGFLWIPLQIMDVSCFREPNCEPRSVLISFAALGIGTPAMIVKMWVYIEQLKVYKNFGYGLTDSAFNTLANLESTSLLYGISHSLVNNNPIVIT